MVWRKVLSFAGVRHDSREARCGGDNVTDGEIVHTHTHPRDGWRQSYTNQFILTYHTPPRCRRKFSGSGDEWTRRKRPRAVDIVDGDVEGGISWQDLSRWQLVSASAVAELHKAHMHGEQETVGS